VHLFVVVVYLSKKTISLVIVFCPGSLPAPYFFINSYARRRAIWANNQIICTNFKAISKNTQI